MFQIDSKIVRSVYATEPNYIIDYDESSEENVCAIYFSSNDIYFPNTEEIFRKRIVEKNFFEWYSVNYFYFLSVGCEKDMLQATKLFTPHTTKIV